MADAQGDSKAKRMLLQHGEKIGLAAAGLLFGLYLLFAVVLSGGDEVGNRIATLCNSAQAQKFAKHTPVPPERPAPTAVDSINVYTNVEQATPAAPKWAMTWTSAIKISEFAEDSRVKEPEKRTMPSVTLRLQDVAVDGITIAWTVGTLPPSVPKAEPEDFEIERRDSKGSWRKISSVKAKSDKPPATAPGTFTWRDTAIQPKADYAYRIKPLDKMRDSNVISAYSNEISARTKDIITFRFENAHEKEAADDQMQWFVFVTIEKFEAPHGKVATRRIQSVGEKIGWWPDPDGAPSTSKHRVSVPGGSSVIVDFDTKCTIKGITKEEADLEFLKCETEFDKATGSRTGCKHVAVKARWSAHKVVYVDADRKEQVFYTKERRIPDQLCSECSGGGSGETNPGEAAERRKKQAETLLADAERLWGENKKKDAARKYEELKTRFADTETWRLLDAPRKSQIDARIAEGKKAK